ncbi:MAG: hypothetical protein WAX89_01270 [Alphaproteobacteria bacterium]
MTASFTPFSHAVRANTALASANMVVHVDYDLNEHPDLSVTHVSHPDTPEVSEDYMAIMVGYGQTYHITPYNVYNTTSTKGLDITITTKNGVYTGYTLNIDEYITVRVTVLPPGAKEAFERAQRGEVEEDEAEAGDAPAAPPPKLSPRPVAHKLAMQRGINPALLAMRPLDTLAARTSGSIAKRRVPRKPAPKR